MGKFGWRFGVNQVNRGRFGRVTKTRNHLKETPEESRKANERIQWLNFKPQAIGNSTR